MSTASASASGLSLIQYVPFKATKVFSKVPPDPIALQNRQYEGCATVVPAATWLPPSYTACIVQETAIPCGAPYPAPTCPAASPSPTPQSHPPKSNSDTSQSQSGSQSNTSSDASVNVSGGGDRSGTQNTAIIIGVTIGAVVLLILIVVLAVRGSRRRHSKIPRSERGGIVQGNNFFTAGIQPGVRALGVYGQRGQRPIGGGGSGGDGGGGGTLVRNGTGDGRDTGGRISASVVRDPSKDPGRRSERDVSRGTPASIPRSQPLAEPGEAQKADVRPPGSPEQPRSRQLSNIRRSRSRYRPGDHGEHFENDFSYSPGPRLERMRRREQRQQEERGSPADEHVPPTRAGREGRNPLNIPLPSSPLPNRRGATGEVSRANDDVQSPSTGRWRTGRAYVPYGQRAAGDDESTG